MPPSGYAHPAYAEAFAEFGWPRCLPRSGGWILERRIGEGPYRDAMGGYPIFTCSDWDALPDEFDALGSDLVSLALVADPFRSPPVAILERLFPDRVIPFKEHFVVDLMRSPASYVASHHRRNARQALASLAVETITPSDAIADWVRLYEQLVSRHGIEGMKAFSRQSFAWQFQVPGVVVQQARHGSEVVGMVVWIVDGDVAYYHLGAYSDAGYKLKASFAIFWQALDLLAERVRWLSLGAGAGLDSAADDGLTRFKRGWATGTRTAYFCGRIFDAAAYRSLCELSGNPTTTYFPAYRMGEFA